MYKSVANREIDLGAYVDIDSLKVHKIEVKNILEITFKILYRIELGRSKTINLKF